MWIDFSWLYAGQYSSVLFGVPSFTKCTQALDYFKHHKGITAENASLLFMFMQYGVSGLTSEWIEKKDPDPPELFAERVSGILKFVI